MCEFVIGKQGEMRWIPEFIADITLPVGQMEITAARSYAEQIRDYASESEGTIDWFIQTAEAAASTSVEDINPSLPEVMLNEFTKSETGEAIDASANLAALRCAQAIGDQSGPIVVEDIQAIHAALKEMLLTNKSLVRDERETVHDRPGLIRLADNRVVTRFKDEEPIVYYPPPWENIDALGEDLLQFCARTDIEPVIQSAVAHARFEEIHPFIDENGRTGRALVHTMWGKRGLITADATLPMSTSLALHKRDYYEALRSMQVQSDLRDTPEAFQPIIAVFCEAITTGVERGEKMRASLRNQLAAWKEVATSPKRLVCAVIDNLPRDPILNVKSVCAAHKVSDRQAWRALRALERGGVLTRVEVGLTKETVWQAVGLLDAFSEGMKGVLKPDVPSQLSNIDDVWTPTEFPSAEAPRDSRLLCGAWMPRARSHCVLFRGHSGAHRRHRNR